jgi:hypothetical protein
MPSTLHHTKPRSTLLAEMREEAMSIILLQQVRETSLDILGAVTDHQQLPVVPQPRFPAMR